ncbi:MAG: hypothetical protein LBJ45_01335 [Holosporaceae bacterium]|jgi:hypothetical protein|nr:hypothetical protein [Holosporaceae bacterium]
MQNQENLPENREKIKSSTRSYVDSLLKINDGLDPVYRNPAEREKAKKQNPEWQVNEILEKIKSLEKLIISDKYNYNAKLPEGKNKVSKKHHASAQRRRGRLHSHRDHGGYPRGIYTVKSGYNLKNSTRLVGIQSSFYGSSHYKTKSHGSTGTESSIAGKIESCDQGRSCPESKSSKLDAKSEKHGESEYFRSTSGCETGCGS